MKLISFLFKDISELREALENQGVAVTSEKQTGADDRNPVEKSAFIRGTVFEKYGFKNGYWRHASGESSPYVSGEEAAERLHVNKETMICAIKRGHMDGVKSSTGDFLISLFDAQRLSCDDIFFREVFPNLWFNKNRKRYYTTREVSGLLKKGYVTEAGIPKNCPNMPKPIRLSKVLCVWDKEKVDKALKELRERG